MTAQRRIGVGACKIERREVRLQPQHHIVIFQGSNQFTLIEPCIASAIGSGSIQRVEPECFVEVLQTMLVCTHGDQNVATAR